MLLRSLLLLQSLTFFRACIFAQFPGDLDPTFDGDGIVTTAFADGYDVIFAMELQPDGKILGAGGTNFIAGTETDFVLLRYLTDGSLDESFGDGGIVTTDFELAHDLANAMYLMPDGRILAAGYSGNDWAIARYLPDGELDTTFSNDGKLLVDFDLENDQAFGIATQSDGKIVVGGFATVDGFYPRFALARFYENGDPDLSFGVDGKTTETVFGRWDQARALILRPDDRIMLVGYTQDLMNSFDMTVMQFNSNGALDVSFGDDGIVRTDFDSTVNFAYCGMLQPDGKLVIAGTTDVVPDQNIAMARYLTNGELDTTFGDGGRVVINVDPYQEEQIFGIAYEPDGRIIIGGEIGTYADGYDYLVAKLLPDGSPDSTISDDGIVITHLGDDWDLAYDVLIQDDTKILAGGFTNDAGDNDFAVLRYFNSPYITCDTITEQPMDVIILPLATAVFNVTSPFPDAMYQWQEWDGVAWTSLEDVYPYSGTHTSELSIAPVDYWYDGLQFRCIVAYDICSDTSNAALLVVLLDDINELQQNLSFSIFPDPVQSILNVGYTNDYATSIKWQICNALGAVCLKGDEYLEKGTDVFQINTLENLPAGIYTCSISVDGVRNTKSFIKN